MDTFEPAPSESARDAERERWTETRDTRQRITEVVIGLQDPASATDIADRADCSVNTARKHLAELSDLGVARRVADDRTTRYVRNDEYVRWRRANELATETDAADLLERLRRLEASHERFRDRYEVATPENVELPEDADHETIHEIWEDTGEWASIREEIAVLKDAIRMAKRRRDELVA